MLEEKHLKILSEGVTVKLAVLSSEKGDFAEYILPFLFKSRKFHLSAR